ncbi:MAG TPA: alpha/beta hydrolase [Acidobacteriota bacterium]|nr:alpha/beta hydrolase [Acidobacteriota bacterium]
MSEHRAWQQPGKTLQLADGRKLGYQIFGDPRGRPVYYCHGWPGSRLECALLATNARPLGLAMVALDRPGMGLSDFQPGRRLTDWPDDVEQVADLLGHERFGLLGISGGGPYALVCARALAPRLTGTCVVSGMGPADAPGGLAAMGWWHRLAMPLARHAPWISRSLFALSAWAARLWPSGVLLAARAVMPGPDKTVLRRPDFVEIIAPHVREIFRQGSRGAAHDGELYLHPWGFGLEEVETPVNLWHGELDLSVPAAFGRAVAQRLPDCRTCFYPHEAHLSTVTNHVEDILQTAAPGQC